MRVCYFGTYERAYPRNAVLIQGLREAGATVIECHAPLWERQRDKSGAHRGRAALGFLWRLAAADLRLMVRYLRAPAHDVLIAGYVGQFDMPLAWLLSRLRRVPVVFNPLVSLFDTFCDDRTLVSPRSWKGHLMWSIDALACHAADLVIVDTEQHAHYFSESFRLKPERMRIVPVGADDRVFRPRPAPVRPPGKPCQVLFVGKLIPLHGIQTILHAAARLGDRPIRFTLIGSGQQTSEAHELTRALRLDHITWIDWVDYEKLPEHYAAADICLGIFGTSAKAARVVPNKVFQALAMARAVITADTPAIRACFTPDEHLAVCPPGDPEALAAAIGRLAADPGLRQRLALAGHALYRTRFSTAAVGEATLAALADIVPRETGIQKETWGDHPDFYGPRHRFREDYLFEAVRRYAPGRWVLDAACGAGSLAVRLAESGYAVVAADRSPGFIAFIEKHRTHRNLQAVRAEIMDLPCCDERFDVVVAGEVLEHLADDGVALREIWRVLRPGGICVISVPADPAQWSVSDDWAGHVRRYDRADLEGNVLKRGFTMLELHHFGFPTVRAYHRFLYLPLLRRAMHRSQAPMPAVRGWDQRLVGRLLHGIFHVDRLFDRLPFGIGLVAVVRKPSASAVPES
jgi:glycosyltransferase involved in cell wall biosynthesis